MKIIDPGHMFELLTLDGGPLQHLSYVKREGPNYPGNVGHHPGTTLQEGWRAEIARLKYLDSQRSCAENQRCIQRLRENIKDLERRAARNHGRLSPTFWVNVENMFVCEKCLHVGCAGKCHEV